MAGRDTNAGVATKQDLLEMERRMADKIDKIHQDISRQKVVIGGIVGFVSLTITAIFNLILRRLP